MENIAPFRPEQQAPQGGQQESFNPSEWERVSCPTCQGNHFEQRMALLKRSRIISPTGQEEVRPVGVIVCLGCGKELGN